MLIVISTIVGATKIKRYYNKSWFLISYTTYSGKRFTITDLVVSKTFDLIPVYNHTQRVCSPYWIRNLAQNSHVGHDDVSMILCRDRREESFVFQGVTRRQFTHVAALLTTTLIVIVFIYGNDRIEHIRLYDTHIYIYSLNNN